MVQNWKGRLCLLASWSGEHGEYSLLCPFQTVDRCDTSSDTRSNIVGGFCMQQAVWTVNIVVRILDHEALSHRACGSTVTLQMSDLTVITYRHSSVINLP